MERRGDCTEKSGHLRRSYDANFTIMVGKVAGASNNKEIWRYGV